MKKVIVLSTLALLISQANQAQAFGANKNGQSQSKGEYQASHSESKENNTPSELIGFGSGALAGSLVAGPIGGIVGGVLGVFIGNDIKQDQQIENKNQDISNAHSLLAQQEMHIRQLQEQYAVLEKSQKMTQLVSMDTSKNDDWLQDLPELESHVQFKTASFLVEDTFTSQLDSLASLLSLYPDLSVTLTGFADARGDSQYNRILSEQRAKAVKDYLVQKRVKPEQIIALGQGEVATENAKFSRDTPEILDIELINDTPQLNNTIESMFFDRRVTINIVNRNNVMTASN